MCFHSRLGTALAIFISTMDWKASFKLQVFTYRFDGLAFLYLLGCISVVNRLCFPGNMCDCWVLTGFCRAVRLQQRQPRTWRTTTSAHPSDTPSPSPSPPCWWGAGTPALRWVPPPHTAGKAAGKRVFLLWPTISLTSHGFPEAPVSEASAAAESTETDNGVCQEIQKSWWIEEESKLTCSHSMTL